MSSPAAPPPPAGAPPPLQPPPATPPAAAAAPAPSPEADPGAARLLRKLRRLNATSEAARAAETAALEAREAHLRRAAVAAETAVRTLGAGGGARDPDALAAALDTRDAALAELSSVAARLSPSGSGARARVEAALAEAAAARGGGGGDDAGGGGDAEARAEAARAARVRAALGTTRGGRPAHEAQHAAGWSTQQPSRWLLDRVPAGNGAADLSLLPRTHEDAGHKVWLPSARSAEVTAPRAHLAACVEGTWRGHAALDAAARGAPGNLTAARAAGPGGTTRASATRFAHDPVPAPTLPAAAFTKTRGVRVPQALLGTLTRAQALAPRHPAYLLESRAVHPAGWRAAPSYPAGGAPLFSTVPATAAASANDARRARDAMVPDRSLALADPSNAGKPGFLTRSAPKPLFSKVALDYEWQRVRDAEEARETEGRFWLAAAEAARPYERPGAGGGGGGGGSSDDEDAAAEAAAAAGAARDTARLHGRGLAAAAGATTALLLSAGLVRRADARGAANARTFSASGRRAYARSVLGPPEPLGGALTGTTPALTLLAGAHGRFAPLRSALVFSSAEGAAGYEEARAAISARLPLGARAFADARAAAEAALEAQEDALERRGTSTGLGATGRRAAATRIHDAALARRALLEL
jgi:hypothetical protein